jgi:hypothetical protein
MYVRENKRGEISTTIITWLKGEASPLHAAEGNTTNSGNSNRARHNIKTQVPAGGCMYRSATIDENSIRIETSYSEHSFSRIHENGSGWQSTSSATSSLEAAAKHTTMKIEERLSFSGTITEI